MNLKNTFSYIISSKIIENSLLDVGEVIAKKGFNTSRKDCLEVLDIYGFKSLKDFKEKSIKLILFYIRVALKDNVISNEEIKNIRFLKLLLNIQEGDFTKDESISNEVSKIIRTQIHLMYRNDNKIDTQESLHKVNLQEVFGLNYDEFLSLNNNAALDAIERGADWLAMDTYISDKEYSKWCKKNDIYIVSEDDDLSLLDKSTRHISQKVKDDVWNRDGGKCVECSSNENLEFDHIIPHSKGGANTYRNIQLLCEPCNRNKSAKIG